jgi:hypothetical protein
VRVCVVGVLVCVGCLVWVAGAFGVWGVAWGVDSFAYPLVFTPGSDGLCGLGVADENFCDSYTVTFTNVGSRASNGTAVTVEDVLPAGVTGLLGEVFYADAEHEISPEVEPVSCSITGQLVKCVVGPEFFSSKVGHGMLPDDTLKLWVNVSVNAPGVPLALVNTARVSGGGGAPASATSENRVGVEDAAFGFSGFTAAFTDTVGGPESLAGGHPYELDTNIDLNSILGEDPEGHEGNTSVRAPRDVVVDLPLGLAGSAVSTPTCTLAELSAAGPHKENGESGCPPDTIIGHLHTYPHGGTSVDGPIYNVVPEKGVVAELGFIDIAGGSHVLYASLAPTRSGYVLRSTSREVPEVPLDQIIADVFGDPAARARVAEKGGAYTPAAGDTAMFTNPSVCTGLPLETRVFMDSWPSPGSYNADGTPDVEGEGPAGEDEGGDPAWVRSTYVSPAVTGCEALAGLFKAETTARLVTAGPGSGGGGVEADSPAGIEYELKVPQRTGVELPATPPLKEAVVTLPAGVSVDPSSANGLQACSEAQAGWEGKTPAGGYSELEDFNAGVVNAVSGKLEATGCPAASKVGSLEVETPALPAERCKEPAESLSECEREEKEKGVVLKEKTPLMGSIYLAAQSANPFASLYAAYIVIDDERTGVVVKLPARLELGGEPGVTGLAAGQIRTVVPDSPQFPFSVLRTRFFAGASAPLRTPALCGSYSLASQLTPWSATPSEAPVEAAGGGFEVTEGAGGGGCPQAVAFAPSFTAGTVSSHAGSFSPLNLVLSRGDGTQELAGLDVTLPAGLAGDLAGIPLCPEAAIVQAEGREHPGEGVLEQDSPSCPASSEIGTVTVAAGAGEHPFYTTGRVYLAGPYDGAPFDAVVITPAVAGPFDLGAVVVRNAITVNENTAEVSARSGAFPTMLDGIPVDIRQIVLSMSRPDFTFNPTSCQPLTVTAQATSTQAQTAGLSSAFYASGCTSLPFKPVLTATVAGQGSKRDGTAFSLKVTTPGLGQANIHKVDLTIPAKLPSRLTTIQKACPETVFNTNPAACDEGSIIGEATVHTPVLNSPLKGPGYLVSHGNAAFPDVEFVLQGENITFILDSKTDIKHGVTYSKLETAPDIPFTTFEALLPAGPHSAFTPSVPEKDNYNLCNTTITLPTQITAQNNAQTSQNTPVQITGCKLHLTSHKTHGHTLTITLYTPGPGQLKTQSNNTHPTTTTTTHQGTTTITLHINNTHKPTKLQITYTPTTGPKQTLHLTTTPPHKHTHH